MKPRERIMATLEHKEPDRVPRFEIWIDALWHELGQRDIADAHANLGQDCVMMPTRRPPGSNAWRTGLDEWGRVWKDGMYVGGIEAGFVGFHGLEPAAGMDLRRIKQKYGNDLVLLGNIDTGVLFEADLEAVRAEVDRCLEQGAPGGGYMLATCNSIFEGMDPLAVTEMFRYEEEVGFY
jgi:hypothetical protein